MATFKVILPEGNGEKEIEAVTHRQAAGLIVLKMFEDAEVGGREISKNTPPVVVEVVGEDVTKTIRVLRHVSVSYHAFEEAEYNGGN